jgi:molybdopterin converting factor small subunit
MNITLKLYASLGDYLPPSAFENTIKIKVPDGASVSEVLTSNHVPLATCHLILINGYYHPPASAPATKLTEGDTLAVWPPIAGG